MLINEKNTPETLMRIPQVAQYLNISQSMAYRLVQNGDLPAVRVNSMVRVRPADLQAFIQRHLSGG
jgi:excisionase family DNA binding protein